jgi:hypothetical protein
MCAMIGSLVATFRDFFFDEDFLGMILLWVSLYLPVSAVLCAPVWWFGKNRVLCWQKLDFLVLIVPYAVWAVLISIDNSGKSLANLFAEPFLLAGATIIAPLSRVALGTRLPPRRAAVAALAATCMISVLIWAIVPSLRE